jgi:hypothetical protein
MRNAEFEHKFITINVKHLIDLGVHEDPTGEEAVNKFISSADDLLEVYEKLLGRKLQDNQYYVCNKDEPYAEKILATILEGEDEKENKDSV